jgi:hypothetical protein
MPSFDVVSEIDSQEVTNAVDQANREVGNRFDFKGSDARFEREGDVIRLEAASDFQLKQMLDILLPRMSKRGIDLRALDIAEPETTGQRAHQTVTLRQGIDQPTAKKIQKLVKDSRLKVQAQVQGEKMRVTGKKRDDLQATIQLLKGAELEVPLQFENFRD